VVLQIDKLAKPAGTPCHNLNGGGCAIYPVRPKVPCRTFKCAWLQGVMDEDKRPDKSGYVMWHTEIDGTMTTVLSAGMRHDCDEDVVEFAKSLQLPVRLERLGDKPVYIKE
jgi:Fe-S-cluster containining protein